jgi:hypothetical protein
MRFDRSVGSVGSRGYKGVVSGAPANEKPARLEDLPPRVRVARRAYGPRITSQRDPRVPRIAVRQHRPRNAPGHQEPVRTIPVPTHREVEHVDRPACRQVGAVRLRYAHMRPETLPRPSARARRPLLCLGTVRG